MYHKILPALSIIILLCLSPLAILAQVPGTTYRPDSNGNMQPVSPNESPKFQGNLLGFISSHLHYPESALESGQEGKVFLQFIVDTDGTMKDLVVLRSSGSKALDAEALRVVRLMTQWKPGTDKGVPVQAYFTLPIVFSLH